MVSINLGVAMALFLGIHDMGGPISEESIQNSWSSYKKACGNHNCQPLHAHVGAEHGKAFCITEAQSVQDVQAAHDEAKVPVKEVIPVKDLK